MCVCGVCVAQCLCAVLDSVVRVCMCGLVSTGHGAIGQAEAESVEAAIGELTRSLLQMETYVNVYHG